jgi:tetraacyldisaccharide-1-P 4'-kinase
MLHDAPIAAQNTPHVIVVGNEKGGSGKTTIAMHVAVALLKEGQRVGTIDQKSLTFFSIFLYEYEPIGCSLICPAKCLFGCCIVRRYPALRPAFGNYPSARLARRYQHHFQF